MLKDNFVALIVDDNVEYREFIVETLRETGHFKFIIEASNGLEAINKFNKQEFHLVVLDLQMPKINGIEFLTRTQGTLKERSNSRVIISSAYITEEIMKESLDLGAHLFLTKPFCPDFFIDKVYTLLKI